MSARSRTKRSAVAIGLALVLGVAACTSGGDYPPTTVPSVTSTPPQGSTAAAPASCTNATQSYNPVANLQTGAASDSVKAIRDRGYLIAGVSADSLLLGSRNPLTGQIEGFDIDMVKAVATAIFGDPAKVQLVVIQASDRLTVLKDKKVDVVARNMTMTCSRWEQISFSAEYYRSGLKILVRKGATETSLAGLTGRKVCAPNGTSTMDKVRSVAGIEAVGAGTHTGCLVLFQQGKVDAIAGDDTVLAGLVAQDPYAVVPTMAPETDEPYGLGITKDAKDLVSYVNTVLDQMKADGRWKAIYDRWFAARLGPAPTPPQSVYGRA